MKEITDEMIKESIDRVNGIIMESFKNGIAITQCMDNIREENNEIIFFGEDQIEEWIEKIYKEELPYWDDFIDKWIKPEDEEQYLKDRDLL